MKERKKLHKDDAAPAAAPGAEMTEEEQAFVEQTFLSSLDVLTPDDIAPPQPPPKRDTAAMVRSILRRVVLAVSVCVFAASAGVIVNTLYHYQVGNALYGELSRQFHQQEETLPGAMTHLAASPQSMATPDYLTSLTLDDNYSLIDNIKQSGEVNEAFERMKAMLSYYRDSVNSDTAGWLKVDNTAMDYIVMQYTDNEYYLDHNYLGEYLPAGSVFMDYRCKKTILSNFNTILYGHNMLNGSMFHGVTDYLDEDFFRENPYITLTTVEAVYTYEIFAVRKVSMYGDYIRTAFASKAEFKEFAERMQKESLFQREGLSFTEDDRIITLSTCTNGPSEERYCLQGKLIKIES